MSFFGIGQNPAYFHRPGEFRPERFMPDPPAEFKGENHDAYHPFSIGAYNVRTLSDPRIIATLKLSIVLT